MEDISTNTHTVIKDSRGRIALIIADDLSVVNIGETIPEGVLGWDKNSGSFSRVVSGSWVASLAQASTGALTANVTGDVTGAVTGNVTGSIAIPSTGSFTQTLGNGATMVTGVIDEEKTLTLGGATTNLSTQIPANSRVIYCAARVTQIIDTATAWELGITAVDTDGYLTTAGVSAGTTNVSQGALVGVATLRSATTVTILCNGNPAATGKIRVKIVYETITPPTA